MVASVVPWAVRLHLWPYSDKVSGAVLLDSLLERFVALPQTQIRDG